MSFEELNLHPRVLKALKLAKYEEPTKVQSKAIPEILKGSDLRISAQTGTGKTAAFLLPALTRLAESPSKGKGPRVLILVPTRELAMQIMEQAKKYSKYLNEIKTINVCGGMPYPSQMRQLSRDYDILVATPGRLIDFLEQGKIQFPRLELLVLDEADRMLDMGFSKPVEQIVGSTPSSRQTLLFSATMLASIVRMSNKFLKKPLELAIHSEKQKHENIVQSLYHVDNLGHKHRILEHLLDEENVENTIIFTSTKRYADELFYQLKDRGSRAAPLHGDMNQSKRMRTIKNFKEGRINIVVATDVAARGIDLPSISHVINFDLPQNVEDYVHRIGRTGRAGKDGIALSFVADKDRFFMKKIEEFTGTEITVAQVEGLEPTLKKSSERSFRQNRNKPFSRFKKEEGGRGFFKGNSAKKNHFQSDQKRRNFRSNRSKSSTK